MEEVWTVMTEQLHFAHHAFNLRIRSFVLMSNHFHMLVSTPDSNLPQAMAFFMRETSREIIRRAGRINQAWGGPYSGSMLTQNSYFLNAYKYVYRNPVKAGLCRQCEEYPFSTLSGLLGLNRLIVPMEADHLLFDSEMNLDHLTWLNQADPDDELEVQKALAKRIFKFQKRNKYQRRADDWIY
jgi:REP element-mobilizing transposase RayT